MTGADNDFQRLLIGKEKCIFWSEIAIGTVIALLALAYVIAW